MAETSKPVLLFDGKCGFCRIWIDYWRQLTGEAVEYAASQEEGARYPQINPEAFKRSVQLVQPDGAVHEGADAVFRSLAYGGSRWGLKFYQRVPVFASASEALYRFIAAHRNFAYHATVLLFGRTLRPLTYGAVQWLFAKAIAFLWLIAFVSYGIQASGLIGSQGVLPVATYLPRLHQFLGNKAYFLAPTVLWWNSSDIAIQVVWIGGIICALFALTGVAMRAALFGAWLLYLSLFHASQDFLGFQWDILLLEAGFLSLFLGYSRSIVWMFRWLLFRLMFLSGAAKLLSGDPTWSGLKALSFHYQTQPIPTPLAWYAQQLPEWVHRASTGVVLFIEIAIPLCILGPRRLRLFAVPWLIGLQILIMLTGNYAFFNWLALALCLFLVDDAILQRWRSKVLLPLDGWRQRLAWAVSAVIAVLSTSVLWQGLTGSAPNGMQTVNAYTSAYALSSNYGLFATMTTLRGEIAIEGSNDGVTWQEYEFRYKPGRLDRRPPWVAPHQPRLDWQMWFAALGTYQQSPWFVNLIFRMLQGSPPVLALFERNPFPKAPPKYIRAQIYEYRFTSWGSKEWWTRRLMSPYLPAVSLESFQQNQAGL